MTRSWRTLLVAVAVASGFAFGCAQAADAVIADNESIFVDGKTFRITPGKATGDAAAQIKKLGAREMGPGALIFRSGARLFIVDSPMFVQKGGPADRQGIYVGANDARPNRILIEYVPPKDSKHQALHESLKLHRALETLQQILSPFRLPVDLTIRTVGCGVMNAWYRHEETGPAITLCYEWLQEIMRPMPHETIPAGVTPMDAVMGQVFYVVLHEFGHALFELYDVPLFGREEDAADQFAAYVMLQFGKDRARKLVYGAAYSFHSYVAAFKDKPNVTIPLAAFSSTHGQPEERFYNLLCTAYGADAEEFAFLVTDEYLPKTRAPHCEREFSALMKAFSREITPHIDRELSNKVLSTRWPAPRSSEQR